MVRRAYVQALSQVTGRRRSSPPLPLMCRIHVRHLETPTAQDISGIDVTASAPLRSSHFPFRPLAGKEESSGDQSSQYYSVLQRTIVEALLRQQFRRDIRDGRFTMDFAQSADSAFKLIGGAAAASLILILSDINMPEGES
jgi:hypothetical protein